MEGGAGILFYENYVRNISRRNVLPAFGINIL
jgi:hypothetical protein